MTLVNVLFHLSRQSLFIGTNRIMEVQFHNSLIPSWANNTANLHALFKLTVRTLKPGHLEEDCPIQRFLETRFSRFFAYGPCNNIYQFEGCFPRGQVSSNAFKNFSGCIVEYLNFIGLSAKTLENLLFWENIVIGQSSSKCRGLSVRTAMYYFSLDGLFTHSNVVKMIQCLPTTSSCYSD